MGEESLYIKSASDWIERFVIKLNLCPFAKAPTEMNEVMFLVEHETHPMPLFNILMEVCHELTSSSNYRTAFLILPNASKSFPAFYDFSKSLEELLISEYPGIRLIAFHPQFRYANTDAKDTSNATNRSPHPMIHVLLKKDLDKAKILGDTANIPERNKELLRNMSWSDIEDLTRDN